MTGPLFPLQRPRRSFVVPRMWWDVLSLLLMVVGVVGFFVTGFVIDWRVGLLFVFAAMVGVGVALGMSKGS